MRYFNYIIPLGDRKKMTILNKIKEILLHILPNHNDIKSIKNELKSTNNDIKQLKNESKPIKKIPTIGGSVKTRQYNNGYGEVPIDIPESWFNRESYSSQQINTWRPRQTLTYVNEIDHTVYTPDKLTARRNEDNKYIPHYLVNPMQDLDYLAIESLTRSTPVGAFIDFLAQLFVGTGFGPVLRLRKSTGDSIKDTELINKYQGIIDDLNEIDDNISSNKNTLDISFHEKILQLINSTNTYNRGALIFSYDRPVKIRDKVYRNIPSSLKFATARDLGIIEIDDSWALKSVQWIGNNSQIPVKDMIYLHNSLTSSRIQYSTHYGTSILSPVIDSMRAYQQIIGVDILAIANNCWAGSALITVNSQGSTLEEREMEYQSLAERYKSGSVNFLLSNSTDDIKLEQVNFEPEFDGLINTCKFLIQSIFSVIGLPQSALFGENETNRATLQTKLELMLIAFIQPMRKRYAEQINKQWYERFFNMLYPEGTEEHKLFKVELIFDEIDFSEQEQRIKNFLLLDGRQQIKNSEISDIIGMEDYENIVEQNAPITPGGKSKKDTDPDKSTPKEPQQ